MPEMQCSRLAALPFSSILSSCVKVVGSAVHTPRSICFAASLASFLRYFMTASREDCGRRFAACGQHSRRPSRCFNSAAIEAPSSGRSHDCSAAGLLFSTSFGEEKMRFRYLTAFAAHIAVTALLLAPMLSPTLAWSQPAWRPSRPVEFITSSDAGGSNDPVARAMQKLIHSSTRVPTPIQVMNKPGGNQTIAVNYLVQKSPDPHFLL